MKEEWNTWRMGTLLIARARHAGAINAADALKLLRTLVGMK